MSQSKHMFLIVSDRQTGTSRVRDLGTDVAAAMRIYGDTEHEVAGRDDCEVVLVSSTSLESLRRTHSSYFGATVDLPLSVG
jgi:hypothetical protein